MNYLVPIGILNGGVLAWGAGSAIIGHAGEDLPPHQGREEVRNPNGDSESQGRGNPKGNLAPDRQPSPTDKPNKLEKNCPR